MATADGKMVQLERMNTGDDIDALDPMEKCEDDYSISTSTATQPPLRQAAACCVRNRTTTFTYLLTYSSHHDIFNKYFFCELQLESVMETGNDAFQNIVRTYRKMSRPNGRRVSHIKIKFSVPHLGCRFLVGLRY